MSLAMEKIKVEDMSESKYHIKVIKTENIESTSEYFTIEEIPEEEKCNITDMPQIKKEPESETESKSDNKNFLNTDTRCQMVLESMKRRMKREKRQLKRAGVCKRCGAICGTGLQQHINQFHIFVPPIPSGGFILDIARSVRPVRPHGTFACHRCPEIFPTYRQREHHQFVHRQISVLQCRYCNKHFPTTAKVRTHKKYAHSNWNTTPRFMCRSCFKPFYNSNRYKRHLQIHRDENKFKCTICCKHFLHIHSFKNHWINEHSDVCSTENSSNLAIEKTEKKCDPSNGGPISLLDLKSEPMEIEVKCDTKQLDTLACNQQVKSEYPLLIKQEINVEMPGILDRQYHCEVCLEQTCSKESILHHMKGQSNK